MKTLPESPLPFTLFTFSLLIWALVPRWASADETLVPSGSVWKYLDNGSNQGSNWRNPGFDDSAWQAGPAQLGYGDGDEATVVGFGPDPGNKYVTTYFRHSFNVIDASVVTSLNLSLLRDDGAVVYFNGVELHRDNMPAGSISFNTFAAGVVGGSDESTFFQSSHPPSLLVEGANLLAVEIHQVNATSSDISFNLQFIAVRPPISIALSNPPDGAIDVSSPATLDATATDPEGDNLTVTFHGHLAPPPAGPDFTIIALPDTQYYASSLNGGDPSMFIAQTDWIIANQTSRNIVFVTHLGDCVENGDNGGDDTEWRHATNALYRLEDPQLVPLPEGLPYGVAVGNHDQSPLGDANGSTAFFNQYFGVSHFSGYAYYGGHSGIDNDNHYQLFSVSGLDFIVVHLEYDTSPDNAVLDWANLLLQTHSNRRAIVVTHHMIDTGNPAPFSSQGQAIYDALKGNPNLFLLLGGHVLGEGQRQDTFTGNTVYSLLADYQGRPNGGNGWLRILEFSPANNEIRIKTYSPTLNQFETDADSEFVLNYDLQPAGDPFNVIQVNSGAPSGSSSTATWSDLAPLTEYEWHVSASDGVDSTTGANRRFTTSGNLSPSVAITDPSDLAVIDEPADITIAANASDPDGLVTKVEFFEGPNKLGEDTSSPYNFEWNQVPAGIYVLTAVAHDDLGAQTTSSSVRVTVRDPGLPNNPPTVSIASPSDGAQFNAPVNINIDTVASDSDGVVTKVEFFEGANKIGENALSPFSFTWSSVVVGSYSLTAIAHDNLGAQTVSAPVGVTVVDPTVITRGPYLQMATPTSMVLRWRTDISGGSRVRYGLVLGSPDQEFIDPASTTEHIALITGLTPGSVSYYELGTLNGWFTPDPGDFFVTPPATGSSQPTRIWVIGDSGTADANAAAVRDAYLTFNAGQPTDLWLMLGDNAYNNGTDSEYQAAVFDLYPSLLPNVVLWPAIGNHDTAGSANPPATLPYFDIFTLPVAGEAGGLASGTERYYSFDYANIHFICLDSMTSDRSSGGPMLTWLASDLAATTQEWLIAFWHHPPYTKGSHNSDTETELLEMRANALPILESAGVDLVLSGHSHSYERSYLIDGHYGNSSTFTQAMKVDGGDGREEGNGAYQKLTGLSPNNGAVYVVAGSSGKIAGGSLDHPAMFVSLNLLGSVVLDLNNDRMDLTFLDAAGLAADHFTLLKSNVLPPPPAAPSDLVATPSSGTEIALIWTDNAIDEAGFRIERSIDNLNFAEIASVGANVTDGLDVNLNPVTTYYYRVKAFNAGGDSAYSAVASATTFGAVLDNLAGSETQAAGIQSGSYQDTWTFDGLAEAITEVESGGKPSKRHTLLQHTWLFNVPAGQNVTLLINAWAPISPDGDTFVFSYSTDDINYVDLFELFKSSDDGVTDAFALPSAVVGAVYIQVVDTDRTQGHLNADTVFVDYLNIQSEQTGPPQLPPPPTDLSATASSSAQIDLTWTDNASTEDGYRIERSTDGINFTTLDTVGPNQTVHFDTTVVPSTAYFYRVRAFNIVGDSDYSNVASATTPAAAPAAPTDLTATAISKAQIDLVWTDHAVDETGFRIERSEDGVGFVEIALLGANTTGYSDTGLQRNRRFYYRVQAFNGNGNSGYSNVADAKTLKN